MTKNITEFRLNYNWKFKEIEVNVERLSREFPKFDKPLLVKFWLLLEKWKFCSLLWLK